MKAAFAAPVSKSGTLVHKCGALEDVARHEAHLSIQPLHTEK